MSSPLNAKNVNSNSKEMNHVNGLLKKNWDSSKGTGSKLSVGADDNNNQENDRDENNHNNNEDDELLSSIHSI
jgi:hypothetical protein